MSCSDDIVIIPDIDRDRYATFGFLGWWDQRRLREATVLVAGAGALGNEVLKNLALAGVGRLIVVDFDTVEASNLSRSVLFRESDRGRNKAEAAADGVRRINPDVSVRAIEGDVALVLGGGVFRCADVTVGCVDNREGRLFLNRACLQAGKAWVDGAIHEMLGEARVFAPGRGGCYECTLVPADYEAMRLRYSCSSLARDGYVEGKVATTPTIASIVGGIQAQEVLKLLHGVDVSPGTAVVFNGLTNDVYNVTYPHHEDCLSHRSSGVIEECPGLSAVSTTVAEMVAHVQSRLGSDAYVNLGFDLLVQFECVRGHSPELICAPITRVSESAARCPVCDSFRWPRQTHILRGTEPFKDRALGDLGVAPFAFLTGHTPGREARTFVLTGDHSRIFDFHAVREE
jgi:molybdopterin/thiamine biosynthesis adenylyltransferase